MEDHRNHHESEASAQAIRLAEMPNGEEIEELCASLPIATLREFSAENTKAGLGYLKGEINRDEYATLLRQLDCHG